MEEKLIRDKSPSELKGAGIEIFNYSKNQYVPLNLSAVKEAKTFLQCDSKDYLFYEFWTDDEQKISSARAAIRSYFEEH